jgi:tRNA dimethylallyltransferase
MAVRGERRRAASRAVKWLEDRCEVSALAARAERRHEREPSWYSGAMSAKPRLVVIGGPTGVGKTAVAVALARRVPLEVISADSRQVYRGMDAATGKPTRDQRRAVVHHLIDVADPDEPYQAARFCADAARLVDEIRGRGRLPLVVGGTGLYIRALIRGLDPAPPADPAFRRELDAIVLSEGRTALHRRLALTAPDVARRLHPHDAVRVGRALEIVRGGGSVATGSEGFWSAAGPYEVVHIGLETERERLAERLRARAAAFVAAGLPEEVQSLLARGYDPALPSLASIGYREFVRVARGDLPPEEALRLMQRDTVRYAKRQMTWFRREPGIEWIDVDAAGGVQGTARRIEARLDEEGMLA